MQRRKFVKGAAVFLAALTLDQRNLFAALGVDPFTIKMIDETTGIFTERGGTILFQLNKKGIIVVDTQFPEQANHLITELKKRSKKPFALLLNTHHHGDHSGGNIAFKDLVKTIVAHTNSLTNQKAAAAKNKSEDKQLYPNETYDTTLTKKVGKEKVTLHYFGAGHTNGDSIIHFEKANVVHMGDLVFNRRHPFVDKTAGANIKSWIEVLNKTVSKFGDETKFVCGHAGKDFSVEISKADITLFATYLQNVLTFVAQQKAEGKTKEQILKSTEIPGSPEFKGDGIERPLTAAWEELSNS